MKTNPEMTESAVLAFVLDDMQFLGLIELKPDGDQKLGWPGIEGKPQVEDQNNINKQAAA